MTEGRDRTADGAAGDARRREAGARAERLALALRANLARRKAQGRARAAAERDGPGTDGAENDGT